jgi:hypothetical protein
MIAFRSTEPVKIDDEEYTLALDIEIIDALEDEFDTPFDKLLPEIIEGGASARSPASFGACCRAIILN